METKCSNCGSWIQCSEGQEGHLVRCPFCGEPTTLDERKSQAAQKIETGKADAHVPIVLEPSGLKLVHESMLSASFSQGGRLLGLCAVAMGADGSIATATVGGKANSESAKVGGQNTGHERTPAILRFAAITADEAMLLKQAGSTLLVALNEARAGTQWPKAMTRIWGEPLPDDLLSTVRVVAARIFEEFQERSQFGAGKSRSLGGMTATVHDLVTRKLSTIPLAELADGMVQMKVDREGMVWINPGQLSSLAAGPILHPSFSDALRKRIRERIMEPLAEVYPRTLDEWEDGFRREQNAEREIAVWLVVTERYTAYVNAHELSKAQRQEVFDLMLHCTMVPNRAAFWATVSHQCLTRDQVEAAISPFKVNWRD